MIKENIALRSCTKTLGKPFDDSREIKCPAYEKINELLLSNGWENKIYNSQKTAVGDRCYLKYEVMMPVRFGGKSTDIIYKVEANIEGTDAAHGNKCSLSLIVETFLPENKLATIDHESEREIFADIKSLFVNTSHDGY